MNTAASAGSTDWRLPKLNEVETLRKLDADDPAVPAICCEPGAGGATSTVVGEHPA